jgi:hypothetical protein
LLRFLISIVMVTFLLGIATFFGSQQNAWGLPSHWLEVLFFVLFITVVVYYNLNKLRGRQPEVFTQFYLLSIVLKMVGGLTLISFIVWTEPSAAIGNVTLFIISYLTLTFLEVYFLLSKSGR